MGDDDVKVEVVPTYPLLEYARGISRVGFQFNIDVKGPEKISVDSALYKAAASAILNEASIEIDDTLNHPRLVVAVRCYSLGLATGRGFTQLLMGEGETLVQNVLVHARLFRTLPPLNGLFSVFDSITLRMSGANMLRENVLLALEQSTRDVANHVNKAHSS